MRTLYLDCGMGAAGDMLTAALLELFPNADAMVEELNALHVPGVRYERELTQKCGITGSHMHVWIDGTEEGAHHAHSHPHDHAHTHEHHHHGSMHEIEHWISHFAASDTVRENVWSVFHRIAQAESQVHGVDMEQIHFHEVGSLDALADVTAVCYLMDRLSTQYGVQKIVASPVHVGSGHVFCAHGILPVPAPATALLLKGVPVYGGQVQGELCTPTGAALLKQFVHQFGDMPVLVPEAVGYGMGKKDFAIANCVRAILSSEDTVGDTVTELCCNLDDMTGEDLGFAVEQMMDAGALDVFTTPIQMKKNRPAVLLTVLCKPEQKQQMAELIFRHTTTIGIRESLHRRYTLNRRTEEIQTVFGPVRQKVVSGYGVERTKPEQADLARIARERQLPMNQVRDLIRGK